MADLPPSWEWDYDGKRWFYRYKPTGHVQYHFPSEGDEFPQFVQTGDAAPSLAPEERLESQQQVKRHVLTAGQNEGRPKSKKAAGVPIENDLLGMSATAKPVSTVWEGDAEEEEAVFQPENFMFLGPGTYADVSPLHDEEEEAAGRIVAGDQDERVKGVKTEGGGKTTPLMGRIEVSPSSVTEKSASQDGAAKMKKHGSDATKGFPVIESLPVVGCDDRSADTREGESELIPSSDSQPVEADSASMLSEAPDTQTVHILDSREVPVEMLGDVARRFDPVGFVAEMATEHTILAHVERYPDPVEMADNSVLAPVETVGFTYPDVGELPRKNKGVGDGKADTFHGIEALGGTKCTGEGRATMNKSALQTSSAKEEEKARARAQIPDEKPSGYQAPGSGGERTPASQSVPKRQAYKIARKQPGSTPGAPLQFPGRNPSTYQAYDVSGLASASQVSTLDDKRRSTSVQREASLMLNSGRESLFLDRRTVPEALSPPRKTAQTAAAAFGKTESCRDQKGEESLEGKLDHVPSVLKPAQNRRNEILPQDHLPLQPQQQRQQREEQHMSHSAGFEDQSGGMSRFPPVLMPARGRTGSHPGPNVMPKQEHDGSTFMTGGTITDTAQRGLEWYQIQITTQLGSEGIQPETTSSRKSHHSPVCLAIASANRTVESFVDGCGQDGEDQRQVKGTNFLMQRRLEQAGDAATEQSRPLQDGSRHCSETAAPSELQLQRRTEEQQNPKCQGPQPQTAENVAAGQERLRSPPAPTWPSKTDEVAAPRLQQGQSRPFPGAASPSSLESPPPHMIQDVVADGPEIEKATSTAQSSVHAVAPPRPKSGQQPPAESSFFNVPPLRNIYNAAAGQPIKPQGLSKDQYQPAAGRRQSDPLGGIHPGVGRVSTLSPQNPPAWSRADSQVSSIVFSPTDPHGRPASSAFGSGTTSTPLPLAENDGAGVLNERAAAAAVSRALANVVGQSPPVTAGGSFLPAQNVPHGPPRLQKEQQHEPRPEILPKVTKKQPSQQQARSRVDLEHPVAHQATSPDSQAPLVASGVQQIVTRSAPGHVLGRIEEEEGLLGRIEEHEEQGRAVKPFCASRATRSSSIMSNLQLSGRIPAHTRQSEEQGPPAMGSPEKGRRLSMSDSASISALDSDRQSQHSRRLSPQQDPVPLPCNPIPRPGPGQAPGPPTLGRMFQGQAFQAQGKQRPRRKPVVQRQVPPIPLVLPGKILQGQILQGQAHLRLDPNQNGAGQPLHDQPTPNQMGAGQTYYGHAHPLSLPPSSPPPGNTIIQLDLRTEGRSPCSGGVGRQSDTGQPVMVHSRTPSNATWAIPLQNTPHQQVQPQRKLQNLMPLPLFASTGASRPASMQGPRAIRQVAADDMGPGNVTMDRSGG